MKHGHDASGEVLGALRGGWAATGAGLALALVAAAALGAGCDALTGGGGGGSEGTDTLAPDSGVDTSVADSAGAADASAGDSGVGDTAPVGCTPGCKPWQTCVGSACKAKSCTDEAACNTGAGPDDPQHWCVKGVCRAWQCEDDADCGEGNKCNDKTFRCYKAQTGCAFDAQCVDDKVCTDDTCDKDTGACKHTPVTGCCETAADCDDGVACTVDSCTKAKCAFTAKQGCCTSDGECADSSACTVDTCKDGACVFTKKPNCCEADGACDDGVDATTDACVKGACVHKLAGMPTTCSSDAACVGTACAKGTCVSGTCSWAQVAGKSCCTTDAACASDTACKVDACVGFVCETSAAKGSGTHLWARFDTATTPGWTVQKGNSVAWFHTSDLLSFAGPRGLRYGVPGKKSWSGGFPNKGTATGPALKVPAQGKLTFQVFFDGEPSAGVHQFGARVVDAAGKATEVWTKNADLKGNTAGKWVTATADLAKWSGQTVKVQLWFDVAVSFPKEAGFGLVIDELRVSGSCP